MRTDDRARYENVGELGDHELYEKTVSIAGLGGVGATVAAILARENISLRLVDKGRVEEQDMHRLSMFYEEDITKFKVKQAKQRIANINPNLQVKSFHEELSENNLFLLKKDIIVDCTNDDETSELIISHAHEKSLPLVIAKYGADTAKIVVLQKKAPAKLLEKAAVPSIEEAGIFGPVTTMAASMVAAQVMKILLGEKGSYIIEMNAWNNELKISKI